MRKAASVAVLFLLAVAVPAAAQEAAESLTQEYWMKPQVGMGGEFEKGYTLHNEWHKKNDKWPWETWQVVVGENVGSYVIRTGGHGWADWDTNGATLAAGGADFGKNAGGAVETISSRILRLLPAASAWPKEMSHPALLTVVEFRVRYAAAEDFVEALGRVNEALQQNAGAKRAAAWYEVVRGDEGGPTYVLVLPHKSWADMQAPGKPFWLRVKEVVGPEEGEELRATFQNAVVSRRSLVLAYRADLSSVPGSE